MAEHIRISSPTNDSESWAYAYLEKELPQHYVLLSGASIKDFNGYRFDCDAVVVGDFAVYVIEVKGFTGENQVSSSAWVRDGTFLKNPLDQVGRNAKIVSNNIKQRLGPNQFAPWVQGCVFVTGGYGGSVSVTFEQEPLPVYTKDDIVKALTDPSSLTVRKPQKLSTRAKKAAYDVICNIALARRQNNAINDYHKIKKLNELDDMELWSAEYRKLGVKKPYVLKILRFDHVSSEEARETARKLLLWEFEALSEIQGLAGISSCDAPIDDGEQLVLPISSPSGKPLSQLHHVLDSETKLKILKELSQVLRSIHNRKIYHRNLSLQTIFYSEDRGVELFDFSVSKQKQKNETITSNLEDLPIWLAPELLLDPTKATPKSDVFSFGVVAAQLLAANWGGWHNVFELCSEQYSPAVPSALLESYPDLEDWIARALEESPSERPDVSSFLEETKTPQTVKDSFELIGGAVLDTKYELIEQIGSGAGSSVWRAHHLLGGFDCAIKFTKCDPTYYECGLQEFSILRKVNHPNIVRVYDMGIESSLSQVFITMEYLTGTLLSEMIDSGQHVRAASALKWFRQLLSVLQYIHSEEVAIIHKDIKPENIMISDDRAVLLDFNISKGGSFMWGTPRYKCPLVLERREWTPFADLWALSLCVYELVVGHRVFEELPSFDIDLADTCPADFPSNTFNALVNVIRGEGFNQSDTDYKKLLSLGEPPKELRRLPAALCEHYGIPPKEATREHELVLFMIQNTSIKKRTRIMEETRKKFGHPTGTVYSLSRLKNVGVLEYYGGRGKVGANARFTDEFTEALEAHGIRVN